MQSMDVFVIEQEGELIFEWRPKGVFTSRVILKIDANDLSKITGEEIEEISNDVAIKLRPSVS